MTSHDRPPKDASRAEIAEFLEEDFSREVTEGLKDRLGEDDQS